MTSAAAKRKARKVDTLLEALERSGCEDAAALLTEVQPKLQMPDSLVGLFTIAGRLSEMKSSLERWAGSDAADAIDRWTRAVRSIPPSDPLANDPYLVGGIRERGVVKPPTQGYKSSHPVWCALWHSYWQPDYAEAGVYSQLQAHLLAAWIRLQGKVDWSETAGRWVQAGRLLRKVHQRSEGWFVLDFVDVVEDVHELAWRLQAHKLGKAGIGNPLCWEAGSLAQLLSDAHGIGLDVFEQRSGGGGGGSRRGTATKLVDAMTPDHSGYWQCTSSDLEVAGWGTGRYAAHGRATSGSAAADLHGQGQDPGEYGAWEVAEVDVEWVLGRTNGVFEPESLPPLASLLGAAKAKARRIAMEAQSLRVEPNRIRLAEIEALLTTLESVYRGIDRGGARSSAEKKQVEETALLAAVSLVTGVEPERACGLLLIRGVSELPVEFPIAFNPQYGMWIRRYTPPERHALQREHRKEPLETWPRVVYEDAWGVGSQLREVPDWFRSGARRAFGHQYRTYYGRWTSRIDPLLREAGVSRRWRAFKNIAGILPSWLAWQAEGDHLPLRLLFGVNDPRSTSQQYYTAWQRVDLATRYHEHMDHLWSRLRHRSRSSDEAGLFRYQPRQVEIGDSWVGNDRAPVADDVRSLVTELRRRVRRSTGKSGGRLQVHNEMAAYTALGFAMATGARAVRTPVPDLRALHRRTGVLALQEKDCTTASHARLVALPGVVIDQIDAYLEHLKQLFAEHPELPRKLRVPATKLRDQSIYNAASYELELSHTLFFLHTAENGKPRPIEFTGRILKEHCDGLQVGEWPVDNAGRHLLRGYLVAAGCPATLINTHLGHWHYGEAPWTGPSAMDPCGYRQYIRPYLERLMDDLDYRLVRL